MQLPNVYVKKYINLPLGNKQLRLAVSQTLFSSHQIDVGTRHLLNSLQVNDIELPDKILDLGCGYGPLGLSLALLWPESHVHLVDRDALAIVFTERNAMLNALTNVEIYGSLGYDDVPASNFDLIISNVPGKAGSPVIRAILTEAQYFLSSNGAVAIVVVKALTEIVEKILEESSANIFYRRSTAAHTVFHYRFPKPLPQGTPQSAFARGIYYRDKLSLMIDESTVTVRTVYGLPEFSALGYGTRLLLRTLQELKDVPAHQVVVFNPGQGHLAVAASKLFTPQTLTLVDRDLLSLRISALNLQSNGYPPAATILRHQPTLACSGCSANLIIGLLREKEGAAVIEHSLPQLASRLTPGGILVVGGGSTAVTRLTKSHQLGRSLRLIKRRRNKGDSVAWFRRI